MPKRQDIYEEIVIYWTKRKLINTIGNIPYGKGLYQIYGDHHIYGRDMLLYIGKSGDIQQRIEQHRKSVFSYVNNLSVSYGEIKDYDGKLEIPESILIANHKPSFNKEYIHDIDKSAKEHKIIVINNGFNQMLKTCCTNYWWIQNKK